MNLMSRSPILYVAAFTLLAPIARSEEPAAVWYTSETLVREILDPAVDDGRRNQALQRLEHLDFPKAAEIAKRFLTSKDVILRTRAAWIAAAAGDAEGFRTLRSLAAAKTDFSGNAVSALGRLRDPGSHDFLRRLLEAELARRDKPGKTPSLLSLTLGLGDYYDPADAALLMRTIEKHPDWLSVTAIGGTGASVAIPVLEDTFRRGKGWTAMAAGLGAARCGSAAGLQYVRKWLAVAPEMADQRENFMANGATDDPHSGKAIDFILSHLGVPADEVLLPELFELARRPEHSRAKAQAWQALLRMNPETQRPQILELAWKNVGFSSSASRLIVLNDEDGAREFVRAHAASDDREERRKASMLNEALRTPLRDRLDWRNVHGYDL